MDLGIVLSIVGIILAVVLWAVSWSDVSNKFKKYSVSTHVKTLNIRSNFKIAVVDDELENYPIEYINNLGFEVKKYDSVSFSDANTLIKNDLILLDVKGVVKEDLDEGGAKLIKIIKEMRPLIPVVAVSSGYFHTELNDYFKVSDATLNKPIDEYKIREILLELKREYFDTEIISDLIEMNIKKLDIKSSKKSKLNKAVIDYISLTVDESDFSKIIHDYARCEAQEIIKNSKVLLDRVKYA